MPFTADEIATINNSTLETYIDRGKVWKQDVANKPMLEAFNARAGKFVGGKDAVSFMVDSAYDRDWGLVGYSGDDQLIHKNPTGGKRARFPWKEHYMGMVVTMTELKTDGIDVVEDGADQRAREMSGREQQALANLLDEKNDKMGATYTFNLDRLLHGDGSADAKALAGIRSIVLDSPATGSTGGISRVANSYWRNDAATAANAAAGGQGAITSAATAGGTLITFMDKAARRRGKFKRGDTSVRYFCGSDFIDAYKAEMRANGSYTNIGWAGRTPDGSMKDPNHMGMPLEWDPTMDDIGYAKRCYALDMSNSGLRLLYMDGQRMKKHNPARPYDRMVMYNGISMTGVLVAKQLTTSGVYDIA